MNMENLKIKKIKKIQIKITKNLTKKKSKKETKKNIGCPSKNINEDDLDCNDKKKARLLLHPDRNPKCVNDATNKFNNYNDRCDSDNKTKNVEVNPEDIDEKDKTKDMKNYEKNYNTLLNKYNFLNKANLNQTLKE